jgi:hypothetical protein
MKTLFYLLVSLALSASIAAQTNRFETPGSTAEKQSQAAPAKNSSSNSDLMDRLRFGGNLGLNFSSNFTYLNLSPRVYYLATEKLWLGTGMTFIWTKYNNNPPPYDEQFVWGFNLSSQYMVVGPLFLQAEYEPLSFEGYKIDNGQIVGMERFWAHGLMLGGGIAQPAGRGMMFISVMYNVLWVDEYNSYYSSPWVLRVGAGF